MQLEPTVHIIGDDAASHQSLARQVKAGGWQVEVHKSADKFIHDHDYHQPGCILLDVKVPGDEDLELLKSLGGERFYLPVIVVSAKTEVSTVVCAMRAGALNFLEKPCSKEELSDAILEALECDAANRKQFMRHKKIQRRIDRLTAGEQEVLRMVVAGKSNSAMASALGLSVRAVEVRRAKLMRKMHAESLAELVQLTIYAAYP
jgi:FixJ family two-component response regulator